MAGEGRAREDAGRGALTRYSDHIIVMLSCFAAVFLVALRLLRHLRRALMEFGEK